MPADPLPLSGAQCTLRHGDYEAVIATVGATLRVLRHAGRDLVVPFDADALRPAYRGATLAPWPNRVVDGRYRFAGSEQRLALTEPSRGHALHGLVAWLAFTPETAETSADRVLLRAVIEPQPGYPHRIGLAVEYRLDDDGLHTLVTARHLGGAPAPYGTGPHPYLAVGPSGLDAATVRIPADSVILTETERLLPGPQRAVTEAPEFDFRTARVIGTTSIDHAYGDLLRDAEGIAELVLVDPEGTGVVMRWDPACPWLQIHTADLAPGEPGHRIGLAVEPMTCPPDAFNSGVDLVVLEAGAEHRAGWSIAALGA